MIKKISIIALISLFLYSCSGAFKPKKVDTRETPINANDRARKNVNEGRGTSLKSIMGGGLGSTNYEFSTSNPMWRASLEILDFLPLTTVDYSGGMIITDWYSENDSDESIKITVRFLANEVRSENLKIIVHKKTCIQNNSCKTLLLDNSKIGNELLSTIVRKAAKLELESKNKKK
jgi:hypothetical protein